MAYIFDAEFWEHLSTLKKPFKHIEGHERRSPGPNPNPNPDPDPDPNLNLNLTLTLTLTLIGGGKGMTGLFESEIYICGATSRQVSLPRTELASRMSSTRKRRGKRERRRSTNAASW